MIITPKESVIYHVINLGLRADDENMCTLLMKSTDGWEVVVSLVFLRPFKRAIT